MDNFVQRGRDKKSIPSYDIRIWATASKTQTLDVYLTMPSIPLTLLTSNRTYSYAFSQRYVYKIHEDFSPSRIRDWFGYRFVLKLFSSWQQSNNKTPHCWSFMRRIHRWPMDSPHKRPTEQKAFPWHDVATGTYVRPNCDYNRDHSTYNRHARLRAYHAFGGLFKAKDRAKSKHTPKVLLPSANTPMTLSRALMAS